jgi:predicted deacylase
MTDPDDPDPDAAAIRAGLLIRHIKPPPETPRAPKTPDEVFREHCQAIKEFLGWGAQSGSISEFGYCVLNAMRHLGMLPAAPERRTPTVRMSAFLGLRASRGGLLTTDVELGVRVATGTTLARIHDVYGDLVETITAPRAGYFVRSTTFAAVASGERVATLGVE